MTPPPIFLQDLACHVRALTLEQIAFYTCAGNFKDAIKSVKWCEARDLLRSQTEFVRHWNQNQPMAFLAPGEPLPSPDKIAYLASKAWRAEPKATLVIRGTARLNVLFGGIHRPIGHASISHEIAVSEVFLIKRKTTLNLNWSLVDMKPGNGILPDAWHGETAVEIIGRYGNASVAAKLTLATATKLELW